MNVYVCNSGSDGNTYIIGNQTESFVLDCGVPLKEVMKKIDYQVCNLQFALCTHIHFDHSKYIKDYLRYGIKVLMPYQVKEKYMNEGLAVAVEPMKKIYCGEYCVTPFEVPHDDEIKCYAYLIEKKEFGKLLYITDCMYCPFNLSKIEINYGLIECNYSNDLISETEYSNGLRSRILETHMELQTCKRLIQSINSNSLRSIGLIHLSSGNGNPARFADEIKGIVDCDVDVWIADKGIEKEFKLEPF